MRQNKTKNPKQTPETMQYGLEFIFNPCAIMILNQFVFTDGGSASPPRLRCFICIGQDCANEEELVTCESGFNCSTVTLNKIGAVDEEKVKVCLPSFLCSSDYVCSNSNETGDVASCNLDCCGFDECNVEPPSPPTTTPSTAPPSTPTTTPGNESTEI